jgi:hypothetical protein
MCRQHELYIVQPVKVYVCNQIIIYVIAVAHGTGYDARTPGSRTLVRENPRIEFEAAVALMSGIASLFAPKMIYEPINNSLINLPESPKRLGGFAFSIALDEHLPLVRPSFRCRENPQIKWIVPCHPVVQLSEDFVQDWPLGFAEKAIPELAVVFKVVPSVIGATYSPCQVIGAIEVGQREPAVGRFQRQRDKGKSEVGDIGDFVRRQGFHCCAFVGTNNHRAFLFQGEERLADGRSADLEFLGQVDLPEAVSRLEDLIKNSLADSFNYEERRFFGLLDVFDSVRT